MEITFLSIDVKSCFYDLIQEIEKSSDGLESTLMEIANYLIGDNDKYDIILNKYLNVDKDVIKKMIFINFIEINYYRKLNGIRIDHDREKIVNWVENSNLNENDILNYMNSIDVFEYMVLINDVILYNCHPSPIYGNSVANVICNSDMVQKIYNMYPLAKTDHLVILDDIFTMKESLIYILDEIILNSCEDVIFLNGLFPVLDDRYVNDIVCLLNTYDGKNLKLPNIHQKIIETYKNRLNIKMGIDYNKILLVEITYNVIRIKVLNNIKLQDHEQKLIKDLNKIANSIEEVTIFYDKFEKEILDTFIKDWPIFQYDDMLLDSEEFENLKIKETSRLIRKLDK